MAKRKTVLPKRKQRDRSRDDDSLLLRSAESLGRVIGALQRELDKAAKRLSADGEASSRRATSNGRAKASPKKTTAGVAARAKTKRVTRAVVPTSRKKASSGGNGRKKDRSS